MHYVGLYVFCMDLITSIFVQGYAARFDIHHVSYMDPKKTFPDLDYHHGLARMVTHKAIGVYKADIIALVQNVTLRKIEEGLASALPLDQEDAKR
jgi:hypothetical protein